MFGEGFDMNALMAQAQKMQEEMARAQETMANSSYVGTAGGDLVSVTVSGHGEMKSVEIKPEALEDVETLQDLIVAAFRSAKDQVDAAVREIMPNVPGLGM